MLHLSVARFVHRLLALPIGWSLCMAATAKGKTAAAKRKLSSIPSKRKPPKTARDAPAKPRGRPPGKKAANKKAIEDARLMTPHKRAVDDVAAASSAKKPRRDCLDQVERLIEKNPSHVDPLILKSRRDSEGRSITDRLDFELNLLPRTATARKGGYMSVSFWEIIHLDFKFLAAAFQALPLMPSGVTVSEDLLSALAPATVKSIPERDT